jgi:hypothetical protein
MRRASFVLVAALALAVGSGCDALKSNWSSQASFTLDRDRMAVGQTIVVTFEKLADEDGRRFWIAIQREDASNTDQEGRIPIPQGAQTMRLTARHPGAHEVRIYTEDNGAPNTIVARKKLRVVE